MIHVALRGMARRKLRTALTAIAIVLGVALITGTYVLTDSIKGAFGGIFTSVYRGTDATVTGKSAFSLSDNNNTTAPPFAQSLLPKIRRLPDVADAVGGVGGLAHLIVNGKVVAFGGAPNLGFSVDPTRPELNTLKLVDGNWPGANQIVIDEATVHKKDLEDRADDRRPGKRADHPHEDLRHRALRRRGKPRRRDALGFRPADGSAALPADREARPDPRKGEARRDTAAARSPDPGDPASAHTGEDGAGAGEVGREGHRELPQLPAGLPARVRRDRVVRRRVRDRELAVDHDQAADARACDPADAGRVAAPGAVLDRRRRIRHRHPRLGRRDRRRPRARRRPLQAVRRRRLHAAEQRSRPAHADGDRRAPRRDPRHRPGEPSPCLPRHAGAADRGRAGRRRAAAGAVREVPAGRLGAADRGRVRLAGLRPVRPRSRNEADPPLHGRRHAADLHRRRAPRSPVRAAARLGARLRRRAGSAAQRARWRATTRGGTPSGQPPPRPR